METTHALPTLTSEEQLAIQQLSPETRESALIHCGRTPDQSDLRNAEKVLQHFGNPIRYLSTTVHQFNTCMRQSNDYYKEAIRHSFASPLSIRFAPVSDPGKTGEKNPVDIIKNANRFRTSATVKMDAGLNSEKSSCKLHRSRNKSKPSLGEDSDPFDMSHCTPHFATKATCPRMAGLQDKPRANALQSFGNTTPGKTRPKSPRMSTMAKPFYISPQATIPTGTARPPQSDRAKHSAIGSVWKYAQAQSAAQGNPTDAKSSPKTLKQTPPLRIVNESDSDPRPAILHQSDGLSQTSSSSSIRSQSDRDYSIVLGTRFARNSAPVVVPTSKPGQRMAKPILDKPPRPDASDHSDYSGSSDSKPTSSRPPQRRMVKPIYKPDAGIVRTPSLSRIYNSSRHQNPTSVDSVYDGIISSDSN